MIVIVSPPAAVPNVGIMLEIVFVKVLLYVTVYVKTNELDMVPSEVASWFTLISQVTDDVFVLFRITSPNTEISVTVSHPVPLI